MPTPARALVALAVLGSLAVGCSEGPDGASTAAGGGKPGVEVPPTTGTCWTGDLAGADPQEVLALSTKYGVTYFAAAHALAKRPSFELTQACGADHEVEVYKSVSMDKVAPPVTEYAALLQTGSKAFVQLSANVHAACMNKPLFRAAAETGLPGAVMTPAFPEGYELGWAPPSPEQWDAGRRTYACTLKQPSAGPVLYASVFTRAFPTALRTCIDSKALRYVDCARKHDREHISVINLRTAVLAGKFPGRKAIRTGPDGPYVDVAPAQYVALDRACTTYLRSVSGTKKLSGVAEIDATRWPTPDGAYPVVCEADAPTTKSSITTEGTVFDR